MQQCPYKHSNLKRLPCDYCEHPTKDYIFLCKTCTNWYDVRDIGGDACGWLCLRADSFWLIIGLILLWVLVSNGFFEPRNFNPAPETPTLNEEIQD